MDAALTTAMIGLVSGALSGSVAQVLGRRKMLAEAGRLRSEANKLDAEAEKIRLESGALRRELQMTEANVARARDEVLSAVDMTNRLLIDASAADGSREVEAVRRIAALVNRSGLTTAARRAVEQELTGLDTNLQSLERRRLVSISSDGVALTALGRQVIAVNS